MDKRPSTDVLDWLGIKKLPDWSVARPLGWFIGAVLVVLVPILFLGALAATVAVIANTIGMAFSGESQSTNLGAGALIAAILGAPFVVWATWLRQQTLRYQKEGHITDRIHKAVEMLGAEKTVKTLGEDGKTVERTVPNIEVRIGGLLSLERIAQDSTTLDKGRDHVRVMEIICAYVRENAPASEALDKPESVDWRNWAASLPPPRADIAIALQIISRRTAEQREVEARWLNSDPAATWVFGEPCPRLASTADNTAVAVDEVASWMHTQFWPWQNSFRSYAGYRPDLANVNLQNVDLAKSNLAGTILNYSRLEGANFSEAVLTGAILQGAELQAARMNAAKIEGAILIKADLGYSNASASRMTGAILTSATLKGANLKFSQLEGADLEGSLLQEASLSGANLQGADLSWTKAEKVRFVRANLTSARIDFSSCSGANFQSADLAGAVGLTQEDVNSAWGDVRTKLPTDIFFPDHWLKKVYSDTQAGVEYQSWLEAGAPPGKPSAT